MDLGISGLGDADEIGRGGFAIVYRAPQPAFDRTVAVKIFDDLRVDESTLLAFKRECLAIGRVGGRANILAVYDQGRTAAGGPYLLMAYMRQGSLGDRINRKGPVPWPEAVDIGVKLARALQLAHHEGILHRDVKPANVLMSDDDEPQLADFGIARLASASQTSSGPLAFAPAYVAPEILEGGQATAAMDIYSLSCTLFTAMAGRPAFMEPQDDNVAAIIYRVSTDPPPDLLRPNGVPEPVCRVIETAMAKDPSARPASAAVFAAQLDAARLEAAAGTRRTGETYREPPPERPSRRNLLLVGLPILLVIVTVTVVALAAQRSPTSPAASTTIPTTIASSPPSTPPSTGPPIVGGTPVIAPGVGLGTQLKESSSVPCRSPHSDAGSSWEVSALRVAGTGTLYQSVYSCNMFASGMGSLDFVLNKPYRLLKVTIGFADDSVSLDHVVKFEVIGDGNTYLTPPRTLHFGETADLAVDVSKVSRLKLQVSELSPATVAGSASHPVWANPALTN